ncbi:uncharacterized protein LOC111134206 isoform X2 [Crassostrea virginica]
MDVNTLWGTKKPINGIDCFFTEESFNKYSRIPSTLEERLLLRIQQIKGGPNCVVDTSQVHTEAHRVELPLKEDDCKSTNCTESDVAQREETLPKKKISTSQENYKKKGKADVPFTKKVPPPRKSQFSHDQQRRYVYLYKKYSHKTTIDTTEEEKVEIRELQLLTTKVVEEQEEFQKFQEKLANTAHKTDYTYMHPASRAYMEDYIQSRKLEAELYPKFYNDETSFGIEGKGQASKMVYIKPLLQLGIVPKMILPTVTQQLKPELPLDSPAVCQQYPVSKIRNHNAGAWNHEPCSMDQNAERLAVDNQAHIVISAGALKCLVDNHAPKHLEEWDISVTIRDYPHKEDDRVRVQRVVYIDRPFIPQHLSSKDKNMKYFKNALKAFIAKPSQKGHVFSKLENSVDIEKSEDSMVQNQHNNRRSAKNDSTNMTSSDKRNKDVSVRKGELFSMEEVSLEDLECFGTAKKQSLTINKETSALIIDKNSELLWENLDGSLGASKIRKSGEKEKFSDSDQDMLRKIRELHKPNKPILSAPITEKTDLDLEMNDLDDDSCKKSCEIQEKSLDVKNEQDYDNKDQERKGNAEEAEKAREKQQVTPETNEERDQGKESANTPNDSENDISKCEEIKAQTIPWRKPDLLNDSEKQALPRKSRRIRTKSVQVRSEDESSEDDEDKLFIMESSTKEMEVIEEAPASPSPASPEPDNRDMEVCKIIPLGSDCASDSAQSPSRNTESPSSPEKGGLSNFSEAIPCPIIPLCRESEDESFQLPGQGHVSRLDDSSSSVCTFDKPVGTPLRRSNRHKSRSQSLESLNADSEQSMQNSNSLENKCRKDIITSDSEDGDNGAPVKRKRGRPRKNPLQQTIRSENDKTPEQVNVTCGMTTRSRSSVGGTSEDEILEKETWKTTRRKRKSETDVSSVVKAEPAKAAKQDNNGRILEKDGHMSGGVPSDDKTAVETRSMQSYTTENILGKIGPQKRVSHVGKQVAAPINKPEGSQVQLTNVKARESKKMKRQSQSVEDKFSLDNILNVQQKLLKSSEEACVPSAPTESVNHNFKFPLRSNVTYNLWDLGGFKVIVRCSIHGVIRDLNQQLSFIHLIPKLEYQCQFGMEQVTASEIARTWISSYIRPNCRVLRARFHTQRTELVSLEELQGAQLIPTTENFSPGKAFLLLQNIFHHLHQLSPGQYVLSHKRSSNKCVIRKATEDNKRGSYDLHFNQLGYADPNVDKMKVPWTPLDPTIMIPYHTLNGRIPLTFDPPDFKFNFSSQSKVTKRKKKNKGKRGKGKVKNSVQK